MDTTLWRFTLVDETQLVGRVGGESNGRIMIVLISGERREIFRTDVVEQTEYKQKAITVVRGKVWEENPNRTRHLWSPSAMPLRQGEGYFSQKQLLFSSYAVGLTDNVSALVGSFVPGLLIGGDAFNVIGALKIADEVEDNVYVGGGGEVMFIPTNSLLAGVPFVSFTYGEPDSQWSVNLGKPFALDGTDTDTGELLVSISGMWRFKGDFAIVTENIFIPGIRTDEGWGVLSMNGLAFRSIRDETAWDLGLIAVGGMPVPWFDYTWYIGD